MGKPHVKRNKKYAPISRYATSKKEAKRAGNFVTKSAWIIIVSIALFYIINAVISYR